MQSLPNQISDYGWFGFRPLPLHFCNEVMPKLKHAGIVIPTEVQNDCDPGDRANAFNASAFQGKYSNISRVLNVFVLYLTVETANYIAQVCAIKNCSAFVGNFTFLPPNGYLTVP